jgi:hypothetical protein
VRPRPLPHPVLIKCPTWDHVEAFHALDLAPGGGLVVRLPFHPRPGEPIALSVELPDQEIVAIDAEVIEASPASDGKRSAVRLHLVGPFGPFDRIATLVAASRGNVADPAPRAEGSRTRPGPPPPEEPPRGQAPSLDPGARGPAPSLDPGARGPAPSLDPGARGQAPSPSLSPGLDRATPPPPLPVDAPVDERIEPPPLPTIDRVEPAGRAMFEELERELGLMRGAPAYQVLGVGWDADVVDIRRAYFALTRRLHPDAVARHRSAAIQQMATEVFVLVNRAYDRMRDAAVASGRAIAAGPDLLPHLGWLASLEDLGDPTASGSDSPISLATDQEAAGPGSGLAGAGADARSLIARGDWTGARQALLASLQRDPRDRNARALYHLASAEALLAEGKPVEARTQLEVALAHEPRLEEALAAMERIGGSAGQRPPRKLDT